jgi:alkylhydroperoxidase/carboxymuconolactone decarboxylase family protein YurZ
MMTKKLLFVTAGILMAINLFDGSLYAQSAREEGLNLKQQSVVTIAAFTANGNLEKLKEAYNEGLSAGLTVNEIKEIITQMYAYCGFPRSLNASGVFMRLLEERKSGGITDVIGKEASPLPSDKSRTELGAENLARLTGGSSGAPPGQEPFIPALDEFLKSHLFGDIFGRDVLDFQTRELATISALASIGVPQLQGHIGISMNVGLTETQLRNWVSVIQTKVGAQEGKFAQDSLQNVLTRRR